MTPSEETERLIAAMVTLVDAIEALTPAERRRLCTWLRAEQPVGADVLRALAAMVDPGGN